jgi:hypothetical protein
MVQRTPASARVLPAFALAAGARRSGAMLFSCALFVSCAKAPETRVSEPGGTPSPSEVPGEVQPGQASSPENTKPNELPAVSEPSSGAPNSGSAAPTERPEKVGHQLVYRLSPDGILILALETEFRPSVKSKRVQGGYVFVVSVEAEAGKAIELLAGKAGPLSLSARVLRPAEQFVHDERGDSKVISLASGQSQVFERTFPSLPEKPLARGQEVEIRFGLWGLGTNEKDRLPVQRFFTVRAHVDAQGAHASVETPEGLEEDK